MRGDPDSHAFLGPPHSAPQTASRSVQPFLYSSRQSVPIFYNGPPLPPQNCLFPFGDLNPHPMRDSLGPQPTLQGMEVDGVTYLLVLVLSVLAREMRI